MDRLDRIENRLQRIDVRLAGMDQRWTRETNHMLNLMATQREVVTKAFEQVNLALLEQDMACAAMPRASRSPWVNCARI